MADANNMADEQPGKQYKAVITGATGATGKYLLSYLIKTKKFSQITSLGRRRVENTTTDINLETEESEGRLKQVIVDMEKLSNEDVGVHFQQADIYLSCLGTTRRQAGSADAFRHIDFGYNYNLAKVAKENGVRAFSLMSTQGADKTSMFLYLKVKGEVINCVKDFAFNLNRGHCQMYEFMYAAIHRELEDECSKLQFPVFTIFRPGFLDRGESSRFVEKLLGFLIDRISSETVASAMCSNALQQLQTNTTTTTSKPEQYVYYNDHIQHMSDTFDLAI